ncbi:hypothetical protein H3J60_004568 [Salmonella enterica]|nr:hypothetical protein [Salmonella enterica]
MSQETVPQIPASVTATDAPLHSREWFIAKSDPFIALALAHAKAMPESRWQLYRRETSLADVNDHLPENPGQEPFSPEAIMAMTREQVINGGCVWLGYKEPEGGEPENRKDTVIAVLAGNPVRYSEKHGGYFWTEPDTRDVVNISLHYPVDFHFEHGIWNYWQTLLLGAKGSGLTFAPDFEDEENF